jgi:hypothetical protein
VLGVVVDAVLAIGLGITWLVYTRRLRERSRTAERAALADAPIGAAAPSSPPRE